MSEDYEVFKKQIRKIEKRPQYIVMKLRVFLGKILWGVVFLSTILILLSLFIKIQSSGHFYKEEDRNLSYVRSVKGQVFLQRDSEKKALKNGMLLKSFDTWNTFSDASAELFLLKSYKVIIKENSILSYRKQYYTLYFHLRKGEMTVLQSFTNISKDIVISSPTALIKPEGKTVTITAPADLSETMITGSAHIFPKVIFINQCGHEEKFKEMKNFFARLEIIMAHETVKIPKTIMVTPEDLKIFENIRSSISPRTVVKDYYFKKGINR